MRFDTSAKPFFVAIFGIAFFSALDAMMKVITAHYPTVQSTGMRYGAGAVVAMLVYVLRGEGWPRSAAIVRSLPRSVMNLVAGLCFFFALSRLTLVDTVALTFLSPFFLALWSRILLGEPLRRITLVSMVVGFAGVIIIALGQFDGTRHSFDALGFLAAVSCGGFYSLSMVLTRMQSAKDSIATLVMLPSFFGALLCLPFMVDGWQPVPLAHVALLAGVGVAGTVGFLSLAWAYRQTHAARLGVTEYTALLWSATLGWFFFSEMPTAPTLIGATVIVAACLMGLRGDAREAAH